jgi:hypothetical protein
VTEQELQMVRYIHSDRGGGVLATSGINAKRLGVSDVRRKGAGEECYVNNAVVEHGEWEFECQTSA